MKNPTLKPAVFLDRDGTLIKEVGYLDSPEKIELIPGAVEALRKFHKRGFLSILISNQSGVARGFFSEKTVLEIHQAFLEMLGQQGAALDGFYFCPHHPSEGSPPYRRPCECRKPAPGLLLQAARDFSIDFSKSYMIGDKQIDIAAGKKLGLKTILVLTGYGREQMEAIKKMPPSAHPDRVVGDIAGAAKVIESQFRE